MRHWSQKNLQYLLALLAGCLLQTLIVSMVNSGTSPFSVVVFSMIIALLVMVSLSFEKDLKNRLISNKKASMDFLPAIMEQLQCVAFRVESDLSLKPVGDDKIFAKQFGTNEPCHDFMALLTHLAPMSLELQKTVQFQVSNTFGMDCVQWRITVLNLPQEVRVQGQGKYLRIIYLPYFEDKKLAEFYVVIHDISDFKKFEDIAFQKRREMEKFISILHVEGSLFELFLSETQKLFEEIKFELLQMKTQSITSCKESAVRIFRAVHTIKANAKLFKLISIQDIAHEVESYLENLRKDNISFSPDDIQNLNQKISAISDEVYSYANLRKEIADSTQIQNSFQVKYRVQWIRSLMNQFATILRDPKFESRHLNLIQKEFSRALMSFDKVSLRDYVRGYNQMLQEIAQQTGKEIAELQIDLEYHQFDSTKLVQINDIILHCLRNAIDHGIEPRAEREAEGKDTKGTIQLRTREEEGMVYIEVSDDGRGIDIERVKSKAVDLGLIRATELARMTESEVLPLLFHPGVSTASIVTEMSGRGLGMDIIREYVQSLNGQLSINFKTGAGTTFSIWIPTANQDYLTPFAVYDLQDLILDVLRDFPRASVPAFYPLKENGHERMIVFCDRLSIIEIFRKALGELYNQIPSPMKIEIEVREHPGRRRVDSFSFFRIKFGVFDESLHSLPQGGQSNVFDAVEHLARKVGGSMFVHYPYWIEWNVPSNIPVRFAEYEFKVLIFTHTMSDLGQHVESFFSQVMGGWKYHAYHAPFNDGLPVAVENLPCLVLLDSSLIESYLELRTEADRTRDGVVLFPQRDLDMDVLNESSILPENLLFIPPAFDEKQLHRSLAGVIFRRFLREMVREPLTSDEEDPSPLGSRAS